MDVRAGSTIKAWWQCPEGDDHEWDARIADRHRGIGCAICSNYKVVKSNSLPTLNPELASEWHPTKNKNLTPRDVKPYSAKKVWWRCKKGHEWPAVIASRSYGSKCPYCSIRAIRKNANFKPMEGPCRVWILDECILVDGGKVKLIGDKNNKRK